MTGKSDQSMIYTNAQLGTDNIGGSVCFWLIPKPDYFFLFLEIWEIINFINVKAEVFIKPFEGRKKKKKVLASAIKCPKQKVSTNASLPEDGSLFTVFWNLFMAEIKKKTKNVDKISILIMRYFTLSKELLLKAVVEIQI